MPSKQSPEPTDWREDRRLRAWELHQQGWKQTEIAAALGVTQGAVSQWLKRGRQSGTEGLRRRPAPVARPRLTPDQRTGLTALLAQGAEAFGFLGDVWTTKRVATVIKRVFGVTYHRAHISRLLRALGLSVQLPTTLATQRADTDIQAWWDERWPDLKKRRSARAAPSSG
jgi:transposase